LNAKVDRPADREQLWTDLAADDAAVGQAAVASLAAAPAAAVALLKDRLRPAAPPDPKHVRALAGDLDSPRFAAREAAFRELEKIRLEAEPELRRLLEEKPSLEVRRRLQDLLAASDVVRAPEEVRRVRAVQALERIGTAEACALLRMLAAGAPAARATREARESLERLQR
jgi:hypothetical protein